MPSIQSGVKPNQAGISSVIASALLIMPGVSHALICDQANFSGAWRAAGEGIICDFQIGNTGNATGTCYRRYLIGDQRVEKFGVEGFFNVSPNCVLSGALEPYKGGVIPFDGEAWAAVDLVPMIARI